MIRKIDKNNMGKSDLGWLKSIFHFSFAEYHNPKNINFGVLRVINDDLIAENTGFPLHPHKDMEIITYVVNGEVTHTDSIGNESIIRRGEVQYMSAGTGIYHSEANNSSTEVLRALQIWILPDFRNHVPNYGEYRFEWSDRKNKFLHMVSSKSGAAPIKINQDINIYTIFLEKGLSEEQVDAAIEMSKKFMSPGIMMAISLFSSLIMGAIVSLISAAIFKNEK